MKLTFVLRNKKNALKISTKTIESFMERIKTDTKDGAVARRRKQLSYGDFISGYDRQYPTHLVYPSAVFEKDDNGNLRMKTFNGVVALTIDGLDDQEVDAVKRAAQILHYTLAAFVGPSEHEVIILVKIAKAESACSPISGGYSEITSPYSTITSPYSTILSESSEIVRKKTKLVREKSKIVSEYSGPTEEEADDLCQEGHRLAATLYQSIMPKPIKTEPVSVKSCFHMPLDATPYYNPKAVALPVSKKPATAQPLGVVRASSDDLGDESSDKEAQEVSRKTKRLMDFLNTHYKFRYNTIMGYTEYKDSSRQYMDWTPVDDRTLKGMTMNVRLNGIDARDNDVRRYVQSNMISLHDPINDYLWELYDKWDGKDHIRKLARTVPTKNPHWEDWFYTWFLGMVRQWQVSNLAKYGNQIVPLLISSQGWNKTTFCE